MAHGGDATEEALRRRRLGILPKDGNPPEWVTIVPRLRIDIKALMVLTSFDSPPALEVRAECPNPVYLVGDASGTGLGSVCWVHGDQKLHSEFGSWMRSVTEEKTSNFRESANLVLRLKKLVKNRRVRSFYHH